MFGIAGEDIKSGRFVYFGADENIYHMPPISKVVTGRIRSDRPCPQTATTRTQNQMTIQLLISGLRWHQARDRFNNTVNIHFINKQEFNRRAFLARVYLQSKCKEGNSPAENLFLAAMIKKYDTKGVCIS